VTISIEIWLITLVNNSESQNVIKTVNSLIISVSRLNNEGCCSIAFRSNLLGTFWSKTRDVELLQDFTFLNSGFQACIKIKKLQIDQNLKIMNMSVVWEEDLEGGLKLNFSMNLLQECKKMRVS
jgi:hypothetical protein